VRVVEGGRGIPCAREGGREGGSGVWEKDKQEELVAD